MKTLLLFAVVFVVVYVIAGIAIGRLLRRRRREIDRPVSQKWLHEQNQRWKVK